MIRFIRSFFRKLIWGPPDAHLGTSRESAKAPPPPTREPQRSQRREAPRVQGSEAPRSVHAPRKPREHKEREHKEREHKESERRPVAWDAASFVVPPVEGKFRFHDLGLPDVLMHAIADLGFQYCTPIQAELLPTTLAGRDAMGRAQTGTGKTAAFLITILADFVRSENPQPRKPGEPTALILAPTRELVLQIEKDAHTLGKYTKCRTVAVFGGMDFNKQKRILSQGPVDIIVATPGRLLDFQRQGDINLGNVRHLVIDEADRMLDMGFIPDTRKIVLSTLPKEKRQTLFFSATFNDDVHRLAASWTRDPLKVEIDPEQVAVRTVHQIVYITTTSEKLTLLYNLIVKHELTRVIVFSNRREDARKVYEELAGRSISSGLLSGDISQPARVRTLNALKDGTLRVLVATDVAARGLHIEGVSHVVNYNLPLDPEDYVHRIGRTGRAGASGTSVSFACEEDGPQIPIIETFIGRSLECTYPEHSLLEPMPQPTVKVHHEPAARSHERRQPRSRGPQRRGNDGRHRGPRHA